MASKQPVISASPSWPMYRALVGVGMICGLLIVLVYSLTLPIIKSNQARALQIAVLEVLPGASSKHSFSLADNGLFQAASSGEKGPQMVHAGFDMQGRLVGIAIEAQGMGYQDIIRILYGYAPHSQLIVGMQVLASKETPGLGDKIEKDSAFRRNFEALEVVVASDGQSLQHAIAAVKSGDKQQPWQVDGITGATISSKAIASILQASSAKWIPAIYLQHDTFQQPGETDDKP